MLKMLKLSIMFNSVSAALKDEETPDKVLKTAPNNLPTPLRPS